MIEKAQIFTQRIVGEMGVGQYTGARFSPTREEIAQLAYSLYESRGRRDGHDVEDWLRAELELFHHYA